MYFLIVVSYSPDDGEMLFKSDSSWDDTITEIGSIVRYQNSDLEIEEAASGALSISVPAFLENFDSIIEILSYLDLAVWKSKNQRQQCLNGREVYWILMTHFAKLWRNQAL